jgi:type III secretory pathway component EscV
MATAVAERTETAGGAGAGTNGKAPTGTGGAAPAASGGGASAAETKAPKTLAGVYVQTPPELRGKLEEVAAQAGVTPQVWVRDHLAQEFGVVLPPVTKRVKYASEEEKKTALKERSKAKNELIKKLLAEYQAAQAAAGAA